MESLFPLADYVPRSSAIDVLNNKAVANDASSHVVNQGPCALLLARSGRCDG
jgi:hypothetical protein